MEQLRLGPSVSSAAPINSCSTRASQGGGPKTAAFNPGLPRWLSGKIIRLPMQETQEMWIQSLGRKDPLEKELATHSSILA